MSKQTIKFIANPTQKAFIEHRPFAGYTRPPDWPQDIKPESIALFSCRMGEGKSAALVWSTWFYTRFNPGARCALIRDTWENMRDTTLVEFQKWFKDGVMGKYIKSEKRFDWFPNTGLTGSVYFMGMDDEKDATKLQSREFGMFGIDEPSPAAGVGGVDELVFTTALSRLRQSGMQWYAARLAQNNPDESHWTYQRFVEPGTVGYTHFQTREPENIKNLPPGYYQAMKRDWEGRPDLQRRFVEGKYGFQQLGKPVIGSWNDEIHLVDGLEPVPGVDLEIGWDGGLTPVCVITQVLPDGTWNILDSIGEEDGGIYQLIEDKVKPLLADRYSEFRGRWRHIGDPALESRDQSDSRQSPVKRLKKELGGRWRKGATGIDAGVNPLNRRFALLGHGGMGMVQVDKVNAKEVWWALRGGWHYPKRAGGVLGSSPVKNHPHSDYGDAMRYLASVLFPEGQQKRSRGLHRRPGRAQYNRSKTVISLGLRQKVKIPDEMREIQ